MNPNPKPLSNTVNLNNPAGKYILIYNGEIFFCDIIISRYSLPNLEEFFDKVFVPLTKGTNTFFTKARLKEYTKRRNLLYFIIKRLGLENIALIKKTSMTTSQKVHNIKWALDDYLKMHPVSIYENCVLSTSQSHIRDDRTVAVLTLTHNAISNNPDNPDKPWVDIFNVLKDLSYYVFSLPIENSHINTDKYKII